MRISSKLHCGIKTMIELAVNGGEYGLKQKDIAIKQSMSVKFLDHIISALKTAGLIYRVSGRNNGFKLTMNPSKVTIYHVYRAFEPEININLCLMDESLCPNSHSCGARCFLNQFNMEMKKYMQSHTIQDLIDYEAELTEENKEKLDLLKDCSEIKPRK